MIEEHPSRQMFGIGLRHVDVSRRRVGEVLIWVANEQVSPVDCETVIF